MHWIQHEHPGVYHAIEWENSAFHSHESTVNNKRKLLGGVSFDQDAVFGGQSHTKAPASFGMPVSTSPNENNISGIGLGIGPGDTIDAGKGKKTDRSVKTDRNGKTGKHEIAGKSGMINRNMVPISVSDMIREMPFGTESGRFKKAASLLSDFYRKVRYSLHAGIGAKQHKQEKKKEKKNISGTRPISKEDMYAAQAQSSYLLDSYNKFGERSVLGK